MAVVSSPASKQSQGKLKSPRKKEKKSASQAKNPISSPAKRNSCPGIRVVGGRIYDSQNGKTCHQCRQKTMDFTAACTNLKKDKPCTIQFCHKCLLNRYGENAEEVAKKGDWTCPKCRGTCNCSFCMKKQGYQPTGQLILSAKASGFTSVSEMLQVKGPENFGCSKKVKEAASEKETAIVSPRKQGKENLFDGKTNSNSGTILSSTSGVHKKSKKVGSEEFKEMLNCSANDNALIKVNSPPHDSKQSAKLRDDNSIERSSSLNGPTLNPEEKKLKKQKRDGLQNKSENDVVIATVKENSPRKRETYQDAQAKSHGDQQIEKKRKKNALKESSGNENGMEDDDGNVDIPLPQGTELITVSGIDIPPEDVGNAFQFLEFCSVFGKILDMKKGQAESVLRDIFQGRIVRRGKYSLTVQFLIQLLSFIQEEQGQGSSPLHLTNGKDSWIHALKECISESSEVAKSMDLSSLDEGTDAYESLSSSKRLRLLNFLCDEILGTGKVRDWMDDQNSKFAERAKEAKVKVLAAKGKEKGLKRKMQDDIAKAIIAKNGAPLSISEHEAIVSKIKSKVAQAHAELLESQGLLSKENKKCDAIRTEPIILNMDGRAYWRLKCYLDESAILLQDVGSGNALEREEKWYAFGVDQKETIEEHVNSLRRKRLRAQRLPQLLCQDNKA